MKSDLALGEYIRKAREKPRTAIMIGAQMLINPRFGGLKIRARGMLGPRVYKKLYQKARGLPDLPFVDVGSAAGATTIAVALAFKRARKKSLVVGIEKCQGGSRERYGNYATNYATLEKNINKYDLGVHVKLYPDWLREGSEDIWSFIQSEKISGFIHDADGRLYRDFQLFFDSVVDGGLIAVDDCPQGRDPYDLLARGYSGKFVRTGVQWELLKRRGFIEEVERCGNFVFARKPVGINAALPFDDLRRISFEADAAADMH